MQRIKKLKNKQIKCFGTVSVIYAQIPKNRRS
jgi:hypothetical protein